MQVLQQRQTVIKNPISGADPLNTIGGDSESDSDDNSFSCVDGSSDGSEDEDGLYENDEIVSIITVLGLASSHQHTPTIQILIIIDHFKICSQALDLMAATRVTIFTITPMMTVRLVLVTAPTNISVFSMKETLIHRMQKKLQNM
jgi:hypothetical protein